MLTKNSSASLLNKEKLHDTQQYIKSAIEFKNKEKDLEKKAKLREEHQMIIDQQNHFDKMAKRYKDIFVAIDEKDKKIQASYRNLKPEIQNLALAESERYKSIEEVVKKQEDSNRKTRHEMEVEKINRRQYELNKFKAMNDYNLSIKQQNIMNNISNKKKMDNYIVMKDYIDNLQHSNVESNKKAKQQQELKQILDQQIKDNMNRKSKDRFLTDKEFYLNKPILDRMTYTNSSNQDEQERIISE